jgi:hypothetical protein
MYSKESIQARSRIAVRRLPDDLHDPPMGEFGQGSSPCLSIEPEDKGWPPPNQTDYP